ncbi:MAG: HAD family phosphatase [Pseudomonadales bacterium]|nr:HAD family phosphatase [Pseudomonadales bacterium]
MTYKALAIDLDGTLLVGEDLSENNRLAVARAHAAGLHIFIATARWRHMATRIGREIGLQQPVIACSGAEVYLPDEDRDIFDHRLPAEFTEVLYDLCNRERCIATVTLDDHVVVKMDGEPAAHLLPSEMQWTPALDPAAHGSPRIAAIQGGALCEYIKAELRPRFAGQVNIYDSIGPSGKLVITITAAAANKGEALKAGCAHFGISPAEVITFGDAENDIEMFRVSGCSVAMGQAAEVVKQAATTVTAPVTEDGVAQAIDRLLKTGAP